MQQALQRVNEEARTCSLASGPPGERRTLMVVGDSFWQEAPLGSPDFSLTAARTVDQGLVQWLQELDVDSGTIQRVRERVLATHDLYQPKLHLCPSFSSPHVSPLIQRISTLEEQVRIPLPL